MKALKFLIMVGMLICVAENKSFAIGVMGDPCADMCSCCAIMIENLEYWNPVESISDATSTVYTFAAAYPDYSSMHFFQDIAAGYADSLGTAYYLAQNQLSAYQICDWGSAGEICSVGCEYPGASSEQDCADVSKIWQDTEPGYQAAPNSAFLCDSCYETPLMDYRCATGYYGSSSNGTSGCTRCPSEDGATGTSTAGSTARTSCYMPSGTKFSNNTGSGQWTGNSYYCD